MVHSCIHSVVQMALVGVFDEKLYRVLDLGIWRRHRAARQRDGAPALRVCQQWPCSELHQVLLRVQVLRIAVCYALLRHLRILIMIRTKRSSGPRRHFGQANCDLDLDYDFARERGRRTKRDAQSHAQSLCPSRLTHVSKPPVCGRRDKST